MEEINKAFGERDRGVVARFYHRSSGLDGLNRKEGRDGRV